MKTRKVETLQTSRSPSTSSETSVSEVATSLLTCSAKRRREVQCQTPAFLGFHWAHERVAGSVLAERLAERQCPPSSSEQREGRIAEKRYKLTSKRALTNFWARTVLVAFFAEERLKNNKRETLESSWSCRATTLAVSVEALAVRKCRLERTFSEKVRVQVTQTKPECWLCYTTIVVPAAQSKRSKSHTHVNSGGQWLGMVQHLHVPASTCIYHDLRCHVVVAAEMQADGKEGVTLRLIVFGSVHIALKRTGSSENEPVSPFSWTSWLGRPIHMAVSRTSTCTACFSLTACRLRAGLSVLLWRQTSNCSKVCLSSWKC